MPINLTTAQSNYLHWLYQGNTIQISLECFKMLGELTYSTDFPYKPDRRALDNLKKAGMLKFHDEIEYGLRWLVVSLSEKGIKFMEEQA